MMACSIGSFSIMVLVHSLHRLRPMLTVIFLNQVEVQAAVDNERANNWQEELVKPSVKAVDEEDVQWLWTRHWESVLKEPIQGWEEERRAHHHYWSTHQPPLVLDVA